MKQDPIEQNLPQIITVYNKKQNPKKAASSGSASAVALVAKKQLRMASGPSTRKLLPGAFLDLPQKTPPCAVGSQPV